MHSKKNLNLFNPILGRGDLNNLYSGGVGQITNPMYLAKILRIWSHLLKKPLIENFIFCPMYLAKSLSLLAETFHLSSISCNFFKFIVVLVIG